MKFVLDGLGGAGAVTLDLRGLCTLTGRVVTTPVRRFGEGTFGPLVAPVAGPNATVLGHVEGRPEGLLVRRGAGTSLVLYCPVPYLPREVLAAVLDEAGVHRFDADAADIVRADSRFVAIHTKAGGARRLSFPRPVAACDAVSGQSLGQGTSLELTLPANSTTILETTDVER